MVVNIAKVVGKGYREFWNSKKRYRVVKGSRGSKKSTTIALWIIYNMMKYPLSNALIIRQIFNTHKDSTYAQLKWAVNKLGVAHLWKFSRSPLEITYMPTGQKILFRGMDNPLSITSITVEKGFLNFVWIEEAFQIKSEEDFNKLDMSIRGDLPPGYFKTIMISFNPWSSKSWLKKRFFDNPGEDTLAITTTYMCNEFLGKDDINLFNTMKEKYPIRYRVEGLGDWGISEGLIFTNWREENFVVGAVIANPKYIKTYGADFGWNDPFAFIALAIDEEAKKIYVYDEIYKRGLTNKAIADILKAKGYGDKKIFFDCAEPKSIQELKEQGVRKATPCIKGKDSIITGIKRLQDYELIIHPRCVNYLIEINNYTWDASSKDVDKPIDDFNHLMDATRYGMNVLDVSRIQVISSNGLGI